jgi:hypothetical protein
LVRALEPRGWQSPCRPSRRQDQSWPPSCEVGAAGRWAGRFPQRHLRSQDRSNRGSAFQMTRPQIRPFAASMEKVSPRYALGTRLPIWWSKARAASSNGCGWKSAIQSMSDEQKAAPTARATRRLPCRHSHPSTASAATRQPRCAVNFARSPIATACSPRQPGVRQSTARQNPVS